MLSLLRSAARPLPPFRPLSLPGSRSLFIQTSSTPNPHSLKFLPGRPVYTTPDDSGFYAAAADFNALTQSPLARRLVRATDAVGGVYLGSDFVTVTKAADASWDALRPVVFSEIMEWYASGEEAVAEGQVSDTTILEDDDEVVQMIKELLEVRIRPAVQEDGGDIKLVGFDEPSGIVKVRLEGSCVGCPSSSVTLKSGVENMLMHYIPEVKGVVAVEQGEEGEEVFPDHDYKDVKVEKEGGKPKQSYEEKLKQAGIPFSD